jgi:hypothetical protein
MKIKLQPPTSNELPGYNPILPPSAITQVMLLSNPVKVTALNMVGRFLVQKHHLKYNLIHVLIASLSRIAFD